MKVAVFGTKAYDRRFLEAANTARGHELVFLEPRLISETAPLAEGFPAVCVFVNDRLTRAVLERLAPRGLRLAALRCAGFNNVDLAAAAEHGVAVARVPAYSPYAVAEHTVGLILSLNRQIHRAWHRVREGNFSLEGLLGFDLHGRTAGVIGTGKIGEVVCRILAGFGCRVLAFDLAANPACTALGVDYAPLDELYRRADVLTLHCPLTPTTHHMIDEQALGRMKRGVMLVNTSRGALLDTRAVIDALKGGHVGSLALDVYEEEENLFFENLSDRTLHDDVFARLLTFPNVLITGHQAFFTRDALERIAETTLSNITAFEKDGVPPEHLVTAERVQAP